MAKLDPAERTELKGAIIRIAHILFEIDARMNPSLSERIKALRQIDYNDDDLHRVYDQYIDDVAEEYCNRMER